MDKKQILELSQEHPIVFFDGICGLCNGVVDGLLKRDQTHRLRFAPLQGLASREVLTLSDCENLETIVFLKNQIVYKRSNAALEIMLSLGGMWGVSARILFLCPRFVRDFFYDRIAKNRYRVWGKKSVCRIPTESERSRFLD